MLPLRKGRVNGIQLVTMLIEPEKVEELKDPIQSAQAVGLRYVTDAMPGVTRERFGNRFRYRAPNQKLVTDAETLKRVKALAIPPAWTDVWICPDPNGHLQATGRDDRRRKQFRYHPRWREVRDETKYARIITFAKALPQIRCRIEHDLALRGLPRNKLLATVVRLLEVSLIRVGNDEYARTNESFGLTTMRDHHVDVNGSTLRFHFRGKAGKSHKIDVRDPQLAKIVRKCQDLPGQELFQYVDEDGKMQDVHSQDVNEYLREISGEDFTAKDFRTWAGTMMAAMALHELTGAQTKAQTKKNITAAIESVAAKLGNTPAVCRKCYVHPHVLDCYLEGSLADFLHQQPGRKLVRSKRGLSQDERAVLQLLRKRLTLEEKLAKSIKRETAARSSAQRRKASRPQSAPRK